MGRLELLGDVVPDADLRLARRAHGDAQDVVVLGVRSLRSRRSRASPPRRARSVASVFFMRRLLLARARASDRAGRGTREIRQGHVQRVAEHADACPTQPRQVGDAAPSGPSASRRSSAARSAIRRMACAPSSNASIQGRHSSTSAVFSTGPRSRWSAAASSRSASAPRSAAAACPRPGPAGTRRPPGPARRSARRPRSGTTSARCPRTARRPPRPPRRRRRRIAAAQLASGS